jgi:hypothetical protein
MVEHDQMRHIGSSDLHRVTEIPLPGQCFFPANLGEQST